MSKRVRGQVTHIPVVAQSRPRPRFNDTFAGSAVDVSQPVPTSNAAADTGNPFAQLLGPSVELARHVAHNYQQRVDMYLTTGHHD